MGSILDFGDGGQTAWEMASARPIPKYRAKLVTLAAGQFEISVTKPDERLVMQSRMNCGIIPKGRKKYRTEREQELIDEQNRGRAVKLARQNVRWQVKQVEGDHLLSFTYRENMTDRERLKEDWKRFRRLFLVRYPEWRYVSVVEEQDRGSLHIHCAVHGKQDIRWLLRCWLLAIGQPLEEVNWWLLHGVKLAEKSLGAVNVKAPDKRWSGSSSWRAGKLAGYLSKYLGKEFEQGAKGSKKHWHSKAAKVMLERYWLKAENFADAIQEAIDALYYRGVTSCKLWASDDERAIWITAETARECRGKVTQGEVFQFAE
jgi:hypothetical protein